MTGYEKLREAISKTVAGHTVLANLKYDDFVAILVAAGIPIEKLANGEMVTVPKVPTEMMITEGWQLLYYETAIVIQRHHLPAAYEAMLAAAPKEPTDEKA